MIGKMRPSEIKETIKKILVEGKQAEFPALFIWGGPGIGKSSVIRQAVQEASEAVGEGGMVIRIKTDSGQMRRERIDGKGRVVDIRLYHFDPSDLKGVPFPDKERKRTEWYPSDILPDDGWGVILWDELPVCPQSVQVIALQAILDRKINVYEIPKGFYQVAAGNRQKENIFYRLSPALLNRFIHIEYIIDVGEPDRPGDWELWAIKNDIDPRVIAFHRSDFSAVDSDGVRKGRGTLLYKFDPNAEAYPTPRSWEFVSHVLKSDFPENLKWELIKGAIGEAAATQFRAFLDVWDQVPNVDEILRGKDIIPERLDVMYATCIAIAVKCSKKEHFERAIEYASKLRREFGLFLLKMLISKNTKYCYTSKALDKFAKELYSEKILF
ncbi:hypothetical protein J7L13_01250 [bacterium]|nr:hypothetical protein [bacterium]